MKFYVIEELSFCTVYDMYGSAILSKGFADRDKAWSL